MQPLVGLAVDRLRAGSGAAVTGAAAAAAALPLAVAAPGVVGPAVVLAGLGNAVFDVGRGVVSLRRRSGRAGPVGVFVAPGAAGLAAGSPPARPAGPAGRSRRRSWRWPWCLAGPPDAQFEGSRAPFATSAGGPDARPVASATAGGGVIGLLLASSACARYVALTLACRGRATRHSSSC